ncbi:ribosome maturation factor RimM [Limibacterium fermenti]|uniref:ribosome maturation factor RimM n=1 Tax=Limibacterium fermenti TaxID=3229863 RepID=UPI000E7F2356|nr:16S rRNA processing protein RimM [Porphyromonadaceae bacterium]
MISRNDVHPAGRLLKAYGIKGELLLLFDRPGFTDTDAPYYFLEIDGLPVPFFVENTAFHSDDILRVKFADINDETQAARYAGLRVYLPRESLSEDHPGEQGADWRFFIGYTVVDRAHGELGVIEEVEDSTLNILFVVRDPETDYLIPATEDFITGVDEQQKIIDMDLPEGLIDYRE